MLSAIQLKKHEFAEISLLPNQALKPGERENCALTVTPKFTAQPANKEETLWVARLRVELAKPEDGREAIYTGIIEVVGQFDLHPDLAKKDRINYACINGGALLYGAAREMIAMISSRSIHGLLELPSIDPSIFKPINGEDPQKAEPKKKLSRQQTKSVDS
jgi:hypothetical protein